MTENPDLNVPPAASSGAGTPPDTGLNGESEPTLLSRRAARIAAEQAAEQNMVVPVEPVETEAAPVAATPAAVDLALEDTVSDSDADFDELAKLFPSSKVEIEKKSPKKRKGGKGCLAILIILALIASGIGVTAWIYRDKIPAVIELVQGYFGVETVRDYSGAGQGELLFTITKGDYGSDIAKNLVAQDVIMTEKSFMELLYSTKPEPVFFPGVYKVANQMSSAEALKAITDQSNRVEHTALIREGISYVRAFEILSEVTGIPVEDFMNETKDLASFGIPAEAPSIEGYLFPATYIFPTD
ncbi:MAG: endolytic transglycosylase MltG, partial [Microbacteriaceae bacterium]